MKRGAPAGTPPVTVLAGFCNTITEHIVHQNGYFVNSYLTDTCLAAQDRFKKYLDYFRIEYLED